MKKYTAEQLNDMLLGEVKEIAKNEFKLALSERGKRFTKSQLISKIIGICMVSDVMEELRQENQKVKEQSIEPILNINNTHTIVSQARMFLQNSLHSYKITNNKKDMVNNIKYVFDTTNKLRSQVAKGELKGMKRKQVNSAISLMSIMVNSYKKKVGVQN